MKPRETIGCHVCNDDARLYSFTRNTRLPRDTFRSPFLFTRTGIAYVLAYLLAALAGLWISQADVPDEMIRPAAREAR